HLYNASAGIDFHLNGKTRPPRLGGGHHVCSLWKTRRNPSERSERPKAPAGIPAGRLAPSARAAGRAVVLAVPRTGTPAFHNSALPPALRGRAAVGANRRSRAGVRSARVGSAALYC